MAACHGSPVYLRTHQTWSAFRRAILQELHLLCQPGATSVSSYRESGRHSRLLRHAVHPLHQRQIHRQGSGRFLQPLLRLEDEHGQAGRIWRHSCQACSQSAGPSVRFTGSFHPPLSQSGERTARGTFRFREPALRKRPCLGLAQSDRFSWHSG